MRNTNRIQTDAKIIWERGKTTSSVIGEDMRHRHKVPRFSITAGLRLSRKWKRRSEQA